MWHQRVSTNQMCMTRDVIRLLLTSLSIATMMVASIDCRQTNITPDINLKIPCFITPAQTQVRISPKILLYIIFAVYVYHEILP